MLASKRYNSIIIACLVLTLGSKVLFQGYSSSPRVEEQLEIYKSRLLSFQFEAIPTQGEGATASFLASKNDCVFRLAAASPDGYTQNFFKGSTQDTEYLSFLFDGHNYSGSQPRLAPFLHLQIYKVLKAMKIRAKYPSIYVVIVDQKCVVDDDMIRASTMPMF